MLAWRSRPTKAGARYAHLHLLSSGGHSTPSLKGGLSMGRNNCVVTVLVVLSLLAMIGGAAVAGEKPAAREKGAWEAWANNDTAALGEYFAEGYVLIVPAGITIGKDENIARVVAEACDVNSYELGEITEHKVAEGVVILTYEATVDATCGGTPVPERLHSSRRAGVGAEALGREGRRVVLRNVPGDRGRVEGSL